MSGFKNFLLSTVIGAVTFCPAALALAQDFSIPGGDLRAALDSYMSQSGVTVIYSPQAVAGKRSKGIKGQVAPAVALSRILAGTGFTEYRTSQGEIGIVRDTSSQLEQIEPITLAQAAAPPRAAVETVTVTSSKLGGADVQSIPISITALSQEQLTATQTAGGPDLVKQVPNLTFTKTNFTGYSINIRGIGTQAISVATDPAVAVAMNDVPFIRNHFFEQEFYDLSQAEVLRGPQGTLYGRNATAGVVNLITAKPTDQFEAMASSDWGNYSNRRYEGMVNIPIVDDQVDLRVAGEWTKRDGYSFNELTDAPIDGRDLWSGRISLTFKPTAKLETTLIWEHFQENDDRLRSGKQLCKRDPGPSSVLGNSVTGQSGGEGADEFLSQGCLPSSLYSHDAYEVPNGHALPYYSGPAIVEGTFTSDFDPYASTTQSHDLRVIESSINPVYKAKNDTLEFNADYAISPFLRLSSQTGYNKDFLWSTEDYNRFNTAPGVFTACDAASTAGNFCSTVLPDPSAGTNGIPASAGIFCDPQLGCSDRLVAQDLSDEHSWQLSQEFRLTSNLGGPLNFSAGANYLHYETEENYYVFINSLTEFSLYASPRGSTYTPGVSDNSNCLLGGFKSPSTSFSENVLGSCPYIDPNSITHLNNEGHNYFLSQNPYVLNSYAVFGEIYYNLASDLKLTGGLRWTDDQKHFVDIPSELLRPGYGYPITNTVDQEWSQITGRAALNWTPKLDFTDQTLVYGSYAHGYKAGGANPPGALFPVAAGHQSVALVNPIHPLTFKPEFIDAFELGSKNTLLDGALTLNGDVFFYNYKNYQISRIVDRTAINDNFDATVKGAELETTWEPAPGLKFNFAGGYEGTRIADGQSSVDLMDRTAGNPNWIVVKPFVTESSNCVVPAYVVAAALNLTSGLAQLCGEVYGAQNINPVTNAPYYPGFDPLAGTPADPYTGQNISNGIDYGPVPNNGEGFDKNLGGNELPNAPHFTTSLSAEYTLPVSESWAVTLHSDFYWQSQSWARVFNDDPYDELRAYSNVNLALILTGTTGWQIMAYVKNVFDTTAITGDFLNSDDSGLTTNVFLTDPRLFGVRVTKNW